MIISLKYPSFCSYTSQQNRSNKKDNLIQTIRLIQQIKQNNSYKHTIYTQYKFIMKINNHLRAVNSFGYKIITQQDVQIMLKWYQAVHHNNTIDFSLDQVQLFGSSLTLVYSYLVMGLTEKGDCIVSLSPLSKSIELAINKLNRTLVYARKQISNTNTQNHDFLTQVKNRIKIHNCKIIILSNPDIIFHNYLSSNKVLELVQYCQQMNVVMIFDELYADLHPSTINSSLSLKADHIVTLRQIGSILCIPSMLKYACIYSNKSLKQKCTKITSKFIKLLPSELALALIQTAMNDQAIKVRQKIIEEIKTKWNIVKEAMQQIQGVHDIYNHNVANANRFWIWVNSGHLDKRVQRMLVEDLGFSKIEEYNGLLNYYKLDLATADIHRLQNASLKQLSRTRPKL